MSLAPSSSSPYGDPALNSNLPPPLARTPDDWTQAVRPLGARTFHAKQLFRWLHGRGVLDPTRMTDLPVPLRDALATGDLAHVPSIANQWRSLDGTRKLLIALADQSTVETVLIPAVSGPKARLPSPLACDDADAAAAVDDDDDLETTDTARVRVTQCISTQVGCAMGCAFCASGVAGLKRHMTADEIVAQVLLARSALDDGEQLTNVVLMGMGEPLHNYDATVQAIRLLGHPDGLALSSRRITVSTSGLVPEIARLGHDFGGNLGLAVSLHAADDELRSLLMPINRKYPLADLLAALRAYPLPRRRRITIEYTLIDQKYAGLTDARRLAKLLRGIPVKVNLIPMNAIAASAMRPPPLDVVLAFQRVLVEAGYSCFIRRRRGDDVSAACGQLALLGAKPKVRVGRD